MAQSSIPVLDRRQFLLSSLATGALAALPFRFALAKPPLRLPAPENANPIQNLLRGQESSVEFNGDEIERGHEVLWNIDGYVARQGGWPTSFEEVDVAIIGGGIAGLSAAYQLREHSPVVLEQDRVFGGNSKGERLGDAAFSIGAAYITEPDESAPSGQLLKELGLIEKGRVDDGAEATVFYENRFAHGFWKAATEPQAEPDFQRVFAKLKAIHKRIKAEGEDFLEELDALSFASWLDATFGRVHPHLLEYFQLYAWSSFAASIDELSASQMLGFIASETGKLMAFPGGNAAIASALYERLTHDIGRSRLRNSCLTIDVRIADDCVLVTYVDPEGKLKALRAKACVFAAPKFIAARVIRDLPAEQIKAISQIRYRGYVVANLILDRALPSPSYELYCLQGHVPPAPTAMTQSQRPFTDIVFGTWAQSDAAHHSILSVYKAFAFDGDRQFLFQPLAHDKHKNRILNGLEPILKSLGLTKANVKGVRMTRWGHALPVAARGLISSGTLAKAHQPFADRVFFANQDNWANPCYETAVDEAFAAVEGAAEVLARKAQQSRR